MGKGYLEAYTYAGNHAFPLEGVKLLVKDKSGAGVDEILSNRTGDFEKIALTAPDINGEDTLAPECALYDIEIPHFEDYKKIVINNVEIFDDQTTVLPIQLHPAIEGKSPSYNTETIVIPTAKGVSACSGAAYATDPSAQGMIDRVLANEVAIPQYITVHLGSPNNDKAANYTLPFKDYLKNVASREVFPTWTRAALKANILAQMSFALNRIYTLHYRSQRKPFDITNNTGWDQAFDPSLSTFEIMSEIVDELFSEFIRRQGRREPFISTYCSGTTAVCAGLHQCESEELGLQGYTAMEILKEFFPSDIQIGVSENFASDVGRYPGYPLKLGSTGNDVLRMQLFLNRISGDWWVTPIPVQYLNGFFGEQTRRAVMEFQERAAKLTADGIIGVNTWYAITLYYTAAKRLGELTSEGERISIGQTPPNVTLYPNTNPVTRGAYVVELQFLLNFIAQAYPTVPMVIQNSVFKNDTKRGVLEFQKTFGLVADGIVGKNTWNALYAAYHSIERAMGLPWYRDEVLLPNPMDVSYPGVPLRTGSVGEDVLLMQRYLYEIAGVYETIPKIEATGEYNAETQNAVLAYQREFQLEENGLIDERTWLDITDNFNFLTVGEEPDFVGTPLDPGVSGNDVLMMQQYLDAISEVYPQIPSLPQTGVYDDKTMESVMAFQSYFGLPETGYISEKDWRSIEYVYESMPL